MEGKERAKIEGESAFTLVELLTVLAIIALLAAVMIGVGRRASEVANIGRARVELAALSAGLESYRSKYGDYPQTTLPAELLQSLIGKRGPRGAAMSERPVIDLSRFATALALDPFASAEAVLVDPWGQPYRYEYSPNSGGADREYALHSAGPDRESASAADNLVSNR